MTLKSFLQSSRLFVWPEVERVRLKPANFPAKKIFLIKSIVKLTNRMVTK